MHGAVRLDGQRAVAVQLQLVCPVSRLLCHRDVVQQRTCEPASLDGAMRFSVRLGRFRSTWPTTNFQMRRNTTTDRAESSTLRDQSLPSPPTTERRCSGGNLWLAVGAYHLCDFGLCQPAVRFEPPALRLPGLLSLWIGRPPVVRKLDLLEWPLQKIHSLSNIRSQ